MRYIRTKDGRIIDTTKYPEHPASWSVQASDYALTIKESENIEELCDEFTYEYDKNSKHIKCWKDTNTGIWYDYDVDFKLNKKEISAIKGAIWTDKGLIYVAKMNENGELELIWVKN